ncbi:hypothetical protein MVEN_00063300 [Mycena venus]|uniref:DUF6532 domain-containing protein n=1 Tax=Mycena venus TaxID=2733690 RepID=A0A8H6ZAA3_9AGAR|nr:hypothetical protein MVEN_00063300 [Mycena venus]
MAAAGYDSTAGTAYSDKNEGTIAFSFSSTLTEKMAPGHQNILPPNLDAFSDNYSGPAGDDDTYHDDDPWHQPQENPPQDDDGPQPVSALEVTIRTIQPTYQQKRKRRAIAEVYDNVETPDSEEEEKNKSRSIASLAADHQDICNLAFDKLKIELTHRKPFPVSAGRGRAVRAQTDEFTELVLKTYTASAFDLGLEDVLPTPQDLTLIRARVQKLVGTPKTSVYTDPDNISPETMFLHPIFQKVYNTYWFGTQENDCAHFFDGMTRSELVTLVLIIVAVSFVRHRGVVHRALGKQGLLAESLRQVLQKYP